MRFDKESYYLCKIVEKSCCAVVLFGVKNVTISTNRSSILDGVIQYHYLSIFKSKPIAMAALLAPIFFAPSSLDSILERCYNNNAKDYTSMQTLLTGVCILFVNLIAGWNGHKASGDLDNQNLERRSAIDQCLFAHPHLCLENFILNRRGIS